MGRRAEQAEFKITDVVYGNETGEEKQNAAFLAMADAAIRSAEKEWIVPLKKVAEKKSPIPLERT